MTARRASTSPAWSAWFARGYDDDDVVADRVDHDVRDPGRVQRIAHEPGHVDALGPGRIDDRIAQPVGPEAADHHGRSTETSRCKGLIVPLAPRDHEELVTEHGLPEGRQPRRDRREVHGKAAHDDDLVHVRLSPQRPLGCHTVLISMNAVIASGPRLGSHPTTRVTPSAAARSTSSSRASGTADTASASTSR